MKFHAILFSFFVYIYFFVWSLDIRCTAFSQSADYLRELIHAILLQAEDIMTIS